MYGLYAQNDARIAVAKENAFLAHQATQAGLDFAAQAIAAERARRSSAWT